MLKEKLLSELDFTSEGGLQMFVDHRGIYWASISGHFVHVADHNGIDDYVDADHAIIDTPGNPEGVGAMGIFWLNEDFNNPFSIAEIAEKVNNITL